jgi:hypothetical protein
MSSENIGVLVVDSNDEDKKTVENDVNAIEIIEDVSKNLEILKKIVGLTKQKKPKKEKVEGAEKPLKLPKWVYLKDGYLYKTKVEGADKKELKKYILEVMLH